MTTPCVKGTSVLARPQPRPFSPLAMVWEAGVRSSMRETASQECEVTAQEFKRRHGWERCFTSQREALVSGCFPHMLSHSHAGSDSRVWSSSLRFRHKRAGVLRRQRQRDGRRSTVGDTIGALGEGQQGAAGMKRPALFQNHWAPESQAPR